MLIEILRKNLLFTTYRKIKDELPHFVIESIVKLTPLFIIASIFEIIGLAIIIPVINILLEPTQISNNYFIGKIYSLFNIQSNVIFILITLVAIGVIFITKNIILYFIYKYQTKVGYTLASRLATNKYNSYLNKPYGFFSENNSAILLRNIAQLPFELVIYIIFPFLSLLNEFFMLVVIIIAMTVYNPILFFATAIFVIPLLLLYNKFYKNKLKLISSTRDKESAAFYKIGLQSIEGFREITVFDKLKYFKPLFKKSMDAYTNASSTEYMMNLFSPKIVETVAIFCLVNIFFIGYLFGKDIQVLTQFMAVFAIASFRIIPSINKIILFSNYIKSSSHVFQYFHEEVKQEPANNTNNNKYSTEGKELSFKNEIEIKDLTFKFKINEKNILENINIKIPKGKTIGIIGPSGSGKSTLLNIILRLYREEKGGIYVDNNKIDNYNRTQWYKLVSYVPQHLTLLDGTIKENIAFGIDPSEINIDLLDKAIKRSQLHEFISNLKEGIETEIGDKGIKISGGQKQRIAIARALYHGGEILIFDEATSSLDNDTEEMLTEAINAISHQDLTIIIVSHRFQTLKYCDIIYKLNNGQLSTPISYNELIN